jgi:cholesterol oxidase
VLVGKRAKEPTLSGVTRGSYDAVVIGSGFGGSVLTYRLSQAGVDVCLLERGRGYPPGSFARGVAKWRNNLWSPDAGLHGLFDVWSFRRMAAIVSSGLGGGSLIYANVLLRKPREWFSSTMPGGEPWPLTYNDLEPHYEAVETMLGATEYPTALEPLTPKRTAFVEGATAAGLTPFPPKLAVTFAEPGKEGEEFDDGAGNRFGAKRFRCRLIAECDAGCNFGAKNTLDLTYLSQLGPSADIRVRCEAKTIAQRGNGYEVGFVDHEDGGRRKTVSARRVILAAGALGSTYLLLRSREAGLSGLSSALGRRFCGNGDVLTFAIGARKNGKPRVVEPGLGPVITSAVRVDDETGRGQDMFLQDGGGPNGVWWVAEVLDGPRTLLRFLPRAARLLYMALSRRPTRQIGPDLSALLGKTWTPQSLPLLGMGRDLPVGRLELGRDGLLDLAWQSGDWRAYYRRARAVSESVVEGLDARFSGLAFRLNYHVTVHPLGGCPMAKSPANGVVDPLGRVHGHEGGLYVVDGSTMPGPVGANPSLTIAAFADRAALGILDE